MTVAAVAVAYVASTVFTMGASATVAPLVIGGLVGAVGSAMVFASADRDVANNENSGPIAYMFNGLVGALTGAVLGTTIMLAPFAAETAVMMYASYGMDIFGKTMTPQTLTKLGSIGCYLVTGVNALFKTFESQERISGENLLRENMAEGVYNDLSDMSAAGTAAIVTMGVMNPNYMSEPEEEAGNSTKNANSIKGGGGTGLDKKLMKELAEKGNSSAGYQHILNHAGEFATKGISSDQLPDFISSALSKGKIVGMQGTRPIYEVMYNGSLQRVAITVGNNGFIVGANPVSLP